ncbi:MAG: YfhO family protein [Acutalibacteraceae bacterium]
MTSALKNTNYSPLKKEKFLYKHRFVFVSFLVPFFLMIYAFYCAEFYPFGDEQIMVIDMWHQYFPFLKILQEKLQTGGSLLYTWQGGGGTNFIALISYYAASPLYLLTVFFPAKYLTEAMALIVVLKISFAAAFMYIYLREMFKRDDLGMVAFAVLYSLSAYAMGYYWCLMWLDVMALLPLCILGLNKLIDEGKFRLYTISLALMMITNYYIGVMMCIFIAIYYPVLYFSRVKAKGAKHCAITTGKAVLFSVIGCCMAAVILIPTYLSMQNTYYIDQQGPVDNSFYNPILDVFSNMLPNVTLTVRGGLPNIYCGVISFMMAILFLLCKKIPAKQRILNCSILGFLVLSFNWNKLDFIWHGNHFPNELPYRYSFVFSFIIVTMACQAYTYLKDITSRQIGAVAAGGIVYVIIAEKLYKETFDYKVIYISILLIAIYGIVLAIYKAGKVKQAVCGLMLFVVVFAEMTNYTVKSVEAVGKSNRTTYYTSYEDVQALKNKVLEEDKGFYRMEVYNNWTCNDPALYGYNGLTQFSSEINTNVTAMMECLGLAADPGSNSFRYLVQTPIINSMLNVKYIISRSETMDDPLFEPLYQSNDSNIYKSKYPLSIGYMVKNSIKKWVPQTENPFETQNEYIYYATGDENRFVLESLDSFDMEASSCDNGSISDYDGAGVSVTGGGGATVAHIAFTAENDGPIYIYAKADNAQTVSGRIGESGKQVKFENNRGCIASIGQAKKGDTIYLDVTFEDGNAGYIDCLVYSLDVNEWDAIYNQLADEMLNVTDYSDTKIKGTIEVKEDGTMMTSIPYEKGWKAYVDGERVDISAINKAFCSIDLKAGKHTVEFKYIPYGFVFGNVVTFVSIALLIALYYVDKIYKKRKAMIAEIENSVIEPIYLSQYDELVEESTAEQIVENAISDESEKSDPSDEDAK